MKRPSVLDSRHSSAVHEREVAAREILLDEAVVELRPADGVKHDTWMAEPVAALSPQIELDGIERSAHGGVERESQRGGRLERDTAGAGLHPGKSGGINLRDTEPRLERNRRRVRSARARPNDDEVEVVHTWEIVNGEWKATKALLRQPPHFALTAVLIHHRVRYRAGRVDEELDLRIDDLQKELRLRLREDRELLLTGAAALSDDRRRA